MTLPRSLQILHRGTLRMLGAIDISERGICLSCPGLEVGAQLKLFVELPTLPGRATLCLVEGVVVWAREGRAGLRFEEPPVESRRMLARFVRHAAERAQPAIAA